MRTLEYRLPTPLEVRQRIEAVGDTIHPTENRRVARDVDEYQLQVAMKYQYLVAGRVSEIAGKYQPGTDLAYPVYINGKECLLLPVKTAKRKTEEGWSLRGPAVPFDKRYEPWAEELWGYLQDNKEPFRFAEKDSSSKRILEAAITHTFQGLHWLLKPTSKRGSKWVPFKSHSLRRCRTLMLQVFHKFEPFDLLFYGGWEDEDMAKTPSGMSHYLYVELDQSPYGLLMLLMQAENFIDKLMVPFNEIHDRIFEKHIIWDRVSPAWREYFNANYSTVRLNEGS